MGSALLLAAHPHGLGNDSAGADLRAMALPDPVGLRARAVTVVKGPPVVMPATIDLPVRAGEEGPRDTSPHQQRLIEQREEKGDGASTSGYFPTSPSTCSEINDQ